jgi:hypothetical protein
MNRLSGLFRPVSRQLANQSRLNLIRSNLSQPKIKPTFTISQASRRNLAYALIMFPIVFVSVDVMTMFLISEFSGLFLLQYFTGITAIGILALLILEGSLALACAFHC